MFEFLEADMFDQSALTMRNILLIPLIVLSIAPELTLCFAQETAKILKKLRAPFLVSAANAAKKKSTFWEIDMTKFEP
jgi:hypothetical protein